MFHIMPNKVEIKVVKYCTFHQQNCEWNPTATTCIRRISEQRATNVIVKPASKDCIICKKHLPASQFNVDNTVKTGLKGSCKACVKERDYKRYHTWDGYIQKKVVASWKSHGNKQMVNRITI